LPKVPTLPKVGGKSNGLATAAGGAIMRGRFNPESPSVAGCPERPPNFGNLGNVGILGNDVK
jgi:hypothetical protein